MRIFFFKKNNRNQILTKSVLDGVIDVKEKQEREKLHPENGADVKVKLRKKNIFLRTITSASGRVVAKWPKQGHQCLMPPLKTFKRTESRFAFIWKYMSAK
ncbi:MAG: hypothetical protein Q7K40_04210 [bacterium]|nr:hypothetical protein [bacterium]